MRPGGARGQPSRWTLVYWVAAALALLTPLLAMRFTKEVNWTAFDFACAAGLLGTVGLGLELTVRRSSSTAYRLGAALALALALLLVWINGAVGIIGSEREAANLLFGVVLAVATAGAFAARFRPEGLAKAMAAAALAQILVPAAALAFGAGGAALILAPEVIGLTAVFTALWLLAAWLFRKAAATAAAAR
jgi:hypothetical protein